MFEPNKKNLAAIIGMICWAFCLFGFALASLGFDMLGTAIIFSGGLAYFVACFYLMKFIFLEFLGRK